MINPVDILDEYDELVENEVLKGTTRDEAEKKVRKFQKEKYLNQDVNE